MEKSAKENNRQCRKRAFDQDSTFLPPLRMVYRQGNSGLNDIHRKTCKTKGFKSPIPPSLKATESNNKDYKVIQKITIIDITGNAASEFLLQEIATRGMNRMKGNSRRTRGNQKE
jgi:hypothetical protein